jgi:hypothetical protein
MGLAGKLADLHVRGLGLLAQGGQYWPPLGPPPTAAWAGRFRMIPNVLATWSLLFAFAWDLLED